jgi:hypothetical protein
MIKNKNRFHIRFDDIGWNKLINDSKACGLSKAEYIRRLVDKKVIKPKQPETYTKLVYEISMIGNNINQLAHQANSMSSTSKDQADKAVILAEKCMTLIREMR